jgi:hypothetical protein
MLYEEYYDASWFLILSCCVVRWVLSELKNRHGTRMIATRIICNVVCVLYVCFVFERLDLTNLSYNVAECFKVCT